MSADPTTVEEALAQDPELTDAGWQQVLAWAKERFGRPASVEALLFLIGIQGRSGDFAVRLKKEMKQDLIMEGTYSVLETVGVYRRGREGWIRARSLPALSESDQERLLRIAIARYLADQMDPNTESE